MDKQLKRQMWQERKTERLANADKYNEGIRESWLPFWVRNTVENHPTIKALFKEGNHDVSVLGQEAHKHCLIIGSGPSLNDWEPYLKDWEGDIMISSSHLAFMEAIGVKPTYCFIIDADPAMDFLVKEADTKDVRLITHPQMDPNILRHWKGEKYFFRMNDPGDDFFGKYVPMMYSEFMDDETKDRWPGIRAYVLNSGNVSNTMIALCQFMGYKNIFMCGVDLGFPGDQYRFNGYKRVDGGFEPDPDKGIPKEKERFLLEGHNGVKTDQVSCFYKYSTLILWGMDNSELYSCSRGILTEIPYLSPQDVLACQGDIPDRYKIENWDKYRIAQEYLRHRGIYIMKRDSKMRTKPTKHFRKIKKRLVRWMLFNSWLRKRLNPAAIKQVVKQVMPAPQIRYRVKFLEWQWDAKETRTVFLGYTAITNKHHVKGWERIKLVTKFNVGRWIKLW